jgi:hypothetical protein
MARVVQGCQIFSWCVIPKTGKNVPNEHKNVTNGRKISQMSVKYSNIVRQMAIKYFNIFPPKFIQIAIFGL